MLAVLVDDRVRRLVFWIAAFGVLALDQATKVAARTFIQRGDEWPSNDWPAHFTNYTNTGAAFGILEGQTAVLIGTALIGLAAIYVYYRSPPFRHCLATAAIAMIFGGAAGNLLDRMRMGGVTDMLDVYRWPTFNVADSGIFVGVTILLIGYLVLQQGVNTGQESAAILAVNDRGKE